MYQEDSGHRHNTQTLKGEGVGGKFMGKQREHSEGRGSGSTKTRVGVSENIPQGQRQEDGMKRGHKQVSDSNTRKD